MAVEASSSAGSVTRLLAAWRTGKQEAFDAVVDRIYPDLRRIASRQLRHDRGARSMDSTALAHEVYMQLLSAGDVDWKDRAHFLAIASKVARRVLVSHARRRRARKRQSVAVTLTDASAIATTSFDAMDLDNALQALEADYPLEAQVVELRYFGGLTIDETAEQLHVGHATVERAHAFACAWLARQLKGRGK